MTTYTQSDIEYLTKIGLEPTDKHHAALGTLSRDSPKTSLSFNGSRKLMQHQAISLYEMKRRENDPGDFQGENFTSFEFSSSRVGVFTDGVGTGKSDVILRLIIEQPSITREHTTYTIENCNDLFQRISFKKWQTTISGNISLLVVPHGLMSQWITLIKIYKMDVVILRNKKDVCEFDEKVKTNFWLVSSTRYRELHSAWIREKRPYFARMIIDECDSIEVPTFPQINAVFYWFVTSSIQNIYNPVLRRIWQDNTYLSTGIRSHGFIKNVLSNINPFINEVIVKCDYKFVHECLNLPDPSMRYLHVKQSVIGTALLGVVPTTVMSMINANDLDAVASYFDIKTVDSPLTLIKKVISSYESTLDETINQETQTLATRKKADELRRRIDVIKDRIKNQDECNICMSSLEDDEDPIKNPTLTQCCHSLFCLECIIRSLESRGLCPKCKEQLNPKDLIMIGNTTTNEHIDEQEEYATKKDALRYIFQQFQESSEVHRVLIFSEFEGGFAPILEVCENMNVNVQQLKGTGATISKRIKDWETSKKTTVLLLNAKRFGAGLNLQSGTDIILWHKLAAKVKGESDLENQVLGRVVRYGLNHEPVVWKLAYPGEYEM
jgi:hypothetical protein